ncbi:hypothetical protein [Thalassobacillus sp. CUG 92003]|uniref:hypothetical protein n=1 Tax=Thalassobacillus sp. CUG 92003 TaxID=2736641 RepID=UPI00351A5620
MLTEKEYEKLSISFRKLASRFLNCNFQNYHENLKRFLLFIEESPTINEFIKENNVKEFDMEKVFEKEGHHVRYELPIRESEEIAFIYQMLNYISDNELDILGVSYGYGSSTKVQNHVDGFNNQIVKQLVDHIVTYLTEVKIDLGYDKKSGTHFSINEFRGQLNHAESQGQVTAEQTYNETRVEGLGELVQKFVEELNQSNEIPDQEKEETVEFLEVAVQEAESENPKKSIMRTAMDKVRGVNELASAGSNLFNLGNQIVNTLGGIIG